MMKHTLLMHRPDGSMVSLDDLLLILPENSWDWLIFDFCGIGQAPNGQSMEFFEERTHSSEKGVKMSWSDLRNFSKSLKQTFDCRIFAIEKNNIISRDLLDKDDFHGYEFFLEAFDSTEWTVYTSNQELFNRFKKMMR